MCACGPSDAEPCGTTTNMKDLKEKLEKLRDDAEDCALISKLATDEVKQETFAKLAGQFREMAAALVAVISAKVRAGEN